MIDYPATQLRLDDTGSGIRIPVFLALGLFLVATAAAVPTLVRRTRGNSVARA
jgi:hypothetical protein